MNKRSDCLLTPFTKICLLMMICKIKWVATHYNFSSLSIKGCTLLGALPSPDDIKHALFDMKPWKAPRPDRFLAGFYRSAWDVVGSDLCKEIHRWWLNPHEI